MTGRGLRGYRLDAVNRSRGRHLAPLLEPGREAAHTDGRRDPAAAAQGAYDDGLRHARPGRGDNYGRLDRGPERRSETSRFAVVTEGSILPAPLYGGQSAALFITAATSIGVAAVSPPRNRAAA